MANRPPAADRQRPSQRIRERRLLGAPQFLPQKREHGALGSAQFEQAVAQHLVHPLAKHVERLAVEIALDDGGVDVTFPAHRRSVAQPLRHMLDGGDKVLFRLCLRVESFELGQRDRGEHRARPGAKILGRELRAADLAQIVVHVLRIHLLLVAVLIEVLEEFLARQVLRAPDDFGDARIVQVDAVIFSTFAAKREVQRAVVNLHVPVPHGAEADRPVGLCVFLVADAHEGRLEQPDHRGQHLFATEARSLQIPRHPAPDSRQRLSKRDGALVFGLVAHRAPVGVVAVLFAPARIAPGRLDMPVLLRADPDVRPGRRNGESLDPPERLLIRHPPSVVGFVAERLSRFDPSKAGVAIIDVAQPGGFGGNDGIGGGEEHRGKS